jgi:hypothetical protein
MSFGSPRRRVASGSERANIDPNNVITYNDRVQCYNAVKGVIETFLKSKNQDVQCQTLQDVLATGVSKLMVIIFTITSKVSANDLVEMTRLLEDMEPNISVGVGLNNNCEISVTIDILAGLINARSAMDERAQLEEARRRNQSGPARIFFWLFLSTVFALLVAWWMSTPSELKWQLLEKYAGVLRQGGDRSVPDETTTTAPATAPY